jgi:hypothetical protein
MESQLVKQTNGIILGLILGLNVPKHQGLPIVA